MQRRPPVADRRDPRGGPATVTEHAVGGPRRGPRHRGGKDRPHPGLIGAEQAEDLARQAEPGGVPAAGGVVDARRGAGVHKRDDLPGHVGRPGGLAMLVDHHVHVRPLALELDHGTDKTRPVRAVEPRRPDHIGRAGQRGEHGPLAGQLGTPVGGARRGHVVLGIGMAGVPGEDVVGGELYQPGAGSRARRGQVRRAAAVDDKRLLLCCLGIVDRCPGRAVDHHVGPGAPDRVGDGGGVGHVKFCAVQPGHGLAAGGQRGHQVGAEHAARPGDKPPRHGTCPDPAGT